MPTTANDTRSTVHAFLTTAGMRGHTADRLLDDVPATGQAALAAFASTNTDAAFQIAAMPVDRVAYLLDLDRYPAMALLFRNNLRAVTA